MPWAQNYQTYAFGDAMFQEHISPQFHSHRPPVIVSDSLLCAQGTHLGAQNAAAKRRRGRARQPCQAEEKVRKNASLKSIRNDSR